MLNLSELGRASPDCSLWHKFRTFRDPDIYLVENMQDYIDNVRSIPFPWYKKPFPNILFSHERAYIIIPNVGIRTIEQELNLDVDMESNFFVVHDDTGLRVMYWGGEEENYFNSIQSFETASETQGLKDDDWVYDIFVRYIIKADLPTIIEVRKYKFSNKKPETKTLAERIKEFIPQFLPDSLPSET